MKLSSPSFLLVFVSLLVTGCWRHRQITAPAAPDRTVPAVSMNSAPAPGLGRMVLDVPDGPAVVESVRGGTVAGGVGARTMSASLEVSQRLCVTPCVVDLVPGPHELRFTLVDDDDRTSVGFVNVDERPGVYRHAIGTKRNQAWQGLVGWPLLLDGVV